MKAHLQSKILVFMSSGKQVRETIGGWAILKVSFFQQVSFIFGTSGKTPTRYSPASPSRKAEAGDATATCTRSTPTKHTVPPPTDLVARGIDFPLYYSSMHQKMQTPEICIHRVGHTARYESHGKALLLLCPSEMKACSCPELSSSGQP